MGCSSSKPADTVGQSKTSTTTTAAATAGATNNGRVPEKRKLMSGSGTSTTKLGAATGRKANSSKNLASAASAKVYTMILDATKGCKDDYNNDDSILSSFWSTVKELVDQDPTYASYVDPQTLQTPLHVVCLLIDKDDGTREEMAKDCILPSIHALLRQCPASAGMKDIDGWIPLHYVLLSAMATTAMATISESTSAITTTTAPTMTTLGRYKLRARVVSALVASDREACVEYLSNNNTVYINKNMKEGDKTSTAMEFIGGVTPLYHALQYLPNDFEPSGSTVEYVSALQRAAPRMVVRSNQSDDDKPLALLYRRFTRQFDLSEQFFTGDNSRPEVVEHRRKYKLAAGNTWKTIEVLLRPTPSLTTMTSTISEDGNSRTTTTTTTNPSNDGDRWRVVHRAVQVECPPDLLRYIVETNAEEMTYADDAGNLPLHYAAKSIPAESSFPSFYSKYVVDELLYKFPEAAGIPDGDGQFPLTLAVSTGKQWIGGGVKSLYDAYPQALDQIDVNAHASLKRALSFEEERENAAATVEPDDGEEVITSKGIVPDEHHDAIMMVQRTDVDATEIVSAMWAHEEDAGVQMLGCVAISRILEQPTTTDAEKLRIVLGTLAAVVNAMKAHPNEPIVQDRACCALKHLACTDGKREVSFVASGAIAAIVGAMQAHVGDPNVQEEGCNAIAGIIRYGGAGRATVVASVSGITALINAISAHQEHEGVQKAGCKALKYLSDFPDANVPELPQGQLQPLLEGIKKDFPSCAADVDLLLSRLS